MSSFVRIFRRAGAALAVAALAFATHPSIGLAQQVGTITGVVVDGGSGLPLAGAQVTLTGLQAASVSAGGGRFLLLNVPAGSQEVRVTFMGYQTATQTVEVTAGATSTLRIALLPGVIGLDEVTIVGSRQGQARALNQQRNAVNVTNVVAADQIGRFPDANIGDAMKRIPGITVINDQGEARFGLIRGTEPRLNAVTLNGERVPSAEGDARAVQLDLIPADMVEAVEVNKVLTPSMDADAIGGSVNIVTRAAPSQRRLSFTGGGAYNLLSEKSGGVTSFVAAERFLADRVGVVVSGSWFDHFLGSDNIEGVWDRSSAGQAYVSEFDIRKYDIRRLRRSIAASTDFRLNPDNTITLNAMYNHRNDWENRYRSRWVLAQPDAQGIVARAEVRHQTKGGGPDVNQARLEDQRTQSVSLNGEHLLADRFRLEWSGSWARASEDRPDERYIEWRVRNLPVRVDISDPNKPLPSPATGGALDPSRFEFRRMEIVNLYTEDTDRNGRMNLTFPLAGSEVQVGARLRMKSKLRDNDLFRAVPLAGALARMNTTDFADYSDPGYLPGSKYAVGSFTKNSFLAQLDVYNPARFRQDSQPSDFLPANYDADERISAGFVQVDRPLGARATFTGGVRLEHTGVDYRGYEFNADNGTSRETDGSDGYLNVLPSALLRIDLDPQTVLRASWTNSLSRPNYYDLVPYRVVSAEDSELSLGNPELDATTAMNFDFMAERYFQSLGLISGGVFFKDLNDFVFSYTRRNAVDPVTGQTFSAITQPLNGAGARILGMEVAFQRQLDFLPGMLRNFGLYGNYTLTDSSVEGLNIEGRESEELPLPGTARHTGNLSLSWDSDRVSVRGSMNFQSSFIDPGELGEEAFFDRYYDDSMNVDLNGSLTLTSSARLFFEANNLTNQPLRYYQGIRSRMMQEEFYNARFSTGVKIDW